MTGVTRDSISLRGAGVVTVLQPRKGARFTQDSLILADFCRLKPGDRILELGAGTGVISLLLAKKFPSVRLVADEFEAQAYDLLCRNIEENGLSDRIVSADRDVKYLSRSIAPKAFDVIVANPPYTAQGTGRTSPSPERQAARHEQTALLSAWLNRQDLLKNKGRYFIIFAANRTAELISALREKKLEPKVLRFVHSHGQKPASLVMIEAVKSAGISLDVLPPLVMYKTPGVYTEEMRRIYDLP
ncbi:MAG: methyltransferase [Nitrospiraceae bacterium]|nr:methyltransferase [Nitrospiraceae bacterium]